MLTSVPELELAHWRRRVTELYARVRASTDPEQGHGWFRAERDALFRDHPQSPLSAADRSTFSALDCFAYDSAYRVLGAVHPEPNGERFELDLGDDGRAGFCTVGWVRFQLLGQTCSLNLFQLEGYAGGLWLPFSDHTSGHESYAGGRYLYDTIKGADLGAGPSGMVLDFNFAYNPSCSYDARWICPLPSAQNRLPLEVRAGERWITEQRTKRA